MNYYKHPKFIQDEKCEVSVDSAIEIFKKAYERFLGDVPSEESLTIILAQCIVETGWFKKGLHCWNFGNTRCDINKLGDGEYFTMFECSEVIKGKEIFYRPPQKESIFQAFKTAEDGAVHHIKFLATKTRYQKAWSKIVNGDYAIYVNELNKAGYFTASPRLYGEVFLSVYKKIRSRVDLPDVPLFSDEEVNYMINAVSASINKNLA